MRKPVQPTARTVFRDSPNSGNRLFWSPKMGMLLAAESGLEADFLALVEVNNDVIAYKVQPEKISYPDEGRERLYYPDVRVKFGDGRVCMVEVKPVPHARKPHNQARFDRLREYYGARGIRFVVATDAYIRRQPRLLNARHMLLHRRVRPSDDLVARTSDLLASSTRLTLGTLEQALGVAPVRRPELFAMALRGHFDIDIVSAPLSADSAITARTSGCGTTVR